MRKALTMLGAIAALALGSFFAAPEAQAVTCDHYPNTPLADTPASAINNWPRTKEKDSSPATSSVYNCYPNGSGGTLITSEFHGLWQGANSISSLGTNQPPNYLANLYYQGKTRIYFYKNVNDLNSHWGTNYSVPGGGGKFFGRVLRTGDTLVPGVPVGSVGVLREHTDGTVYNLNTIKSTVYHELGHAYDLLVGEPSSYQPGSWYTARNNDIHELNHKTRSYAFSNVSIRSECQDMYDSPWDPVEQEGDHDNWEVAKCQWPYFTLDQELFANIFAKRAGGLLGTTDHPQLLEFSTWLGNRFWDETRDYIDQIDY